MDAGTGLRRLWYKQDMWRGRLTWIFLGLVVVGVLWPVVAGAVSCGGCCKSRTSACGNLPATGFSLCCFHSATIIPAQPPSGFVPVDGSRLAPVDETGGPPPPPQDILHVPIALLT